MSFYSLSHRTPKNLTAYHCCPKIPYLACPNSTYSRGRISQFDDGLVETVVEIYIDVCWPEPLAKFFPAHHRPGPLQENEQQFEGLLLKFDLAALLEQLAT
jgi:hypothetical protein